MDWTVSKNLGIHFILPPVKWIVFWKLILHLVVDLNDDCFNIFIFLTFLRQLSGYFKQICLEKSENQIFNLFIKNWFNYHQISHQDPLISIWNKYFLKYQCCVKLFQNFNALRIESKFEQHKTKVLGGVIPEWIIVVFPLFHKLLYLINKYHFSLRHIE